MRFSERYSRLLHYTILIERTAILLVNVAKVNTDRTSDFTA